MPGSYFANVVRKSMAEFGSAGYTGNKTWSAVSEFVWLCLAAWRQQQNEKLDETRI